MLSEDIVVKSSKGPLISVLIDALIQSSCEAVNVFNGNIVQSVQVCLKANKKGKIAMSTLWRNFHVLRLSSKTRAMWHACIQALNLPHEVLEVSEVTLQVVLKRMMQNVIKQLTVSRQTQTPHTEAAELSIRELNVIRYIAGYVVLKLKRKFPMSTDILDHAVDTTFTCTENILTVQDYSRMWTEQVDRGGLYHVHDDFFNLLIEMEYICRRYLDVRVTPSDCISKRIKEDILESTKITNLWSGITTSDEKNLIFNAIIKLWINIRVHSFAQNWSDLLQAQATAVVHEKAIRKTLKRKGTEKDNK